MKRILSLALVILILSSNVLADGGTYVIYSYGQDTLSLVPESRQYAFISHENGLEELRIAVKADLNGTQAFWILPLPARPGDISVDVLSGFPKLRGYEVESRVGYLVNQAYPLMVLTQMYPIFFVPLIIWQLGVFNMGGGAASSGALADSGVVVETHLEKKGLTIEVLEADSWSALENYLQKRNVRLPEESKGIVGDYVGKKYSFVVTWISNVSEYRGYAGGGTLSMQAKFPTNRLYYPLRLTAVYGKRTVPINLYVKGFVTPELIEGVPSNVGYYVNEDGMQYTKIAVNSQASNFVEDLWIDKGAPFRTTVAYLLGLNVFIAPLLIFLLSSCLAALLAGLLVYRGKYTPLDYVKVGLYNLLTLIGVVYAANKTFESGEKGKKRNWTLITILLTMPIIVIVAYALTEVLTYSAFGYGFMHSYHGNMVESAVSYAFYSLMSNIVYIAIIAASLLLYKKSGSRAWLIPALWFGGVVLVVLVGLAASGLQSMPVMRTAIIPIFAVALSLLYLPIVVLFFIMPLAGFLLALSGRPRVGGFCLTFSILFTIFVLVSSFSVMAIYPPQVTYGGMVTASGFAKIKPQLSSTGMNHDATFRGVFTNGAGTRIDIRNVDIESMDGSYCKGEVEAISVAAGENFAVNGVDCGEGQSGDVYTMKVSIEYDITIGGVTSTRFDEGRIRGPFE